MGDGRSDAGYVSFIVFQLRQNHFGMMFNICFWYMFTICTYVYGYKYHHELCYKSPISDMGVMSL